MINSNEITVGYWSTKGLGSVCRQMIIYAGVPLKAKNYKLEAVINDAIISYDGTSWTDNDKIDLKKKNSLINLPYIQLKDTYGQNVIISQSQACLMYLGRKFNMIGQNDTELSQCEQLLFETSDLRGIITAFAYTHFLEKEEELLAAKEVFKKAFENNNSGKLQKFETWISNNNNNNNNNNNYFLLNDHISSADFNLFDILDFYIEFLKHYNFIRGENNTQILHKAGYPNLSNFYSQFLTLPKMKKYFDSILYKLPYTNKSATFGSGINGDRWDAHNQTDDTPNEVIID